MLTWLLIFTLTIGVAAYFRLSQVTWNAMLGVVLLIFSFTDFAGIASLLILWVLYLAVVIPLNLAKSTGL